MCLFCKIIAGEIPSFKVYEDGQVLAFLDIAPVHKGHLLVVPKRHYANLEEIPDEELQSLITVVKKCGLMLKTKLAYAGYNVFENNDPVAGQEIPHLHFHVIPRIAGDNLPLWRKEAYAPGEAEAICSRLKAVL
ncbi:MAG TPA: HIT family protein [bacterium]|jgi:histidine triad (HIT) family protein|nr:MAG: HIT-like protein [Parcubacteria group bacterium ADurb.Bin115]HNU81179.1 HIT family protein [bacterium]HOD86670.1 HIT family protein [bacterium]HPW05372.1 HIT family protein [bacterium]HPY99283.1 HIT family protein [bacterium]